MSHVESPTSTWVRHDSLDGLRTLAVYLVVLYHAGVGWLGGGFVGVDLFFVLSGFLVSTILFEELAATGRLDLAHFYDRRVRRLLPAAVVVVMATSAVSLVFLSSVRRVPLVGDAQAALLYVANWHFLAASNDYFAAPGVDDSPFLHFWSLSIEEQFYAGFPLLLLGLARLDRRWRHGTFAVLAGLFAASLTAQLAWARVDVNHAYYGTETRFYQLLAGALLALALHHRRLAARTRQARPRQARNRTARSLVMAWSVPLVSLTGMLLVATSVLALNPSYRGLAATLFAVPLIATLAVDDTHPLTRLFSRPGLVYLGTISYGTYLWHWPVVVLLREVVTPTPAVTAAIVVGISTGLAAASFQLLERPIRTRKVPTRWRTPVLATGLATSVAAALVVVPNLLEQQRMPDLVAAPAVAVGTAANVEGPVPDIDFRKFARDEGPRERYCHPGEASRCAVVDGQPGPNVMLVGDSHARMLEPTLVSLAEEHGFNLSVNIIGGCPWPRDLVNQRPPERAQQRCAQVRRELYAEVLQESRTDLVILTQQGRDSDYWDGLLGAPPGEDDRAPIGRVLYDTTASTLEGLVSQGIRALVVQSIWLPTDDFGDPLDCLATADRVQQCRVPISPRTRLLDADYLAAASRWEDVHTVDINPIICPAAPVCDPVLDGIPVWRDVNHYSPAVILHERDRVWAAIQDSGAFAGLPASVSPRPRRR